MTKKNIILTSIFLLILVIIIGISFDIAKAKTLGVAHLGLKTASVTSASSLGGLELLGNEALVLDELKDTVALNDGLLSVDAKELSRASLNLLVS